MKKIWTDGCFDLFHYGHANALRQARQYGDELVVGIHTCDDILKNKSLPIMYDKGRYFVAESCRWVDQVVEGSPFVTDMNIVKQYGCSIVVHGDDIVTNSEGIDSYEDVKKQGKFFAFKRTLGISTTDIVGRMLLGEKRSISYENTDIINELAADFVIPRKDNPRRVVYVDGHFDFFQAGHIDYLKKNQKTWRLSHSWAS